MKRNINQIAQVLGLQLVSTTSEASGYPRNLRTAVIGFENWQQAEEVSAEIGGDIIKLHKKTGWQLWAREGEAYEPYELSGETFGDNCITYDMDDEQELIDDLREYCYNYYDFGKVLEHVERLKAIYEEIQDLEEGEFIAVNDGNILGKFQRKSMAFSEDNNHYLIAVVESEVDYE